MESYTTHQSLPISKHSLVRDAVSFTEELRVSYQPDSPVLPFPLQESEKAKKMTGTFGLKPSNVYAEYDPTISFWKMFQVCLPFEEKESVAISGEYLETFTKHGIMQNGVLSELTMLEHPTEGKGCGLWPTPRNKMTGSIRPERCSDKFNNLESVLARQTWPTPNTRDYKDGSAEACKNVPVNALLGRAVHGPTPRQFMHKDSSIDRGKGNLGGKVQGQLNPDWVEWLMGWIPGLTSLEPMTYNDIKNWRSLYANKECRTQRSSKNVSKLGNLRTMPKTESKTQTPQGQKPTKQQKVESSLSMSHVPHGGSCSGGRLGTRTSQAKHMQDMWGDVSAKTNQKGKDLLQGMLKEERRNKCNEEMGKSQESENMSMVWQRIHIQTSEGKSLWPILWQLAFVEQKIGWWNVDPADSGSIPRIATGIKDRVNRLKAIGNGQVSQCMAMAWKILGAT